MQTADSIQRDIEQAISSGFRSKLIARGQARAIIWKDGILPSDAPGFSSHLSYDLHSYGYALLELGLRLIELGGDMKYARSAFEYAASALEAAIAKGDPKDRDRVFHFVVAASAYHLAHLSARAYSLLNTVKQDENFSYIEKAISLLMLRDFTSLRNMVLSYKVNGLGSDIAITSFLDSHFKAEEFLDDDSFLLDGIDIALTDTFIGTIAMYLLAIDRGDRNLKNNCIQRLNENLKICAEINLVPQWWVHRLTVHILEDLWNSTFHEQLPLVTSGIEAPDWLSLRELFIAVLARRPRAEIDLWPSQIEAASRTANQNDNLVVSLPTSAGKTRIAELCILRCLASGQRVIFITPLRALSAQTENTLQRTFGPLGKTVSSLYGSIGVSGFDVSAIRKKNIVVTTPEKLDFAIRNDPSLLDDVGLMVFDEGHMIGLNEREVRYEVQIQKLLRRTDAAKRRIVCLSAILPDGEQLEDFANWLSSNQKDSLIKNDWRPTRLRFGEVVWNGTDARLNLRVGDERPFVPRFMVGAIPPIGKRVTTFPRDLGELCLATAWRLVNEGQTVLVFCPVRAHVEPFAGRIIDLHKRGSLSSLLECDEGVLSTAIALGEEWLGPNNPILHCLKLGVAIHHGALPSAFRKEVERLLRENILKVTISSPTLAQGLNLSATAIIIHSISRNSERIDASEFKNVIGRAGRAYVDMEGLVLYPMYDKIEYRTAQWEGLIQDLSSRQMESGIFRLLVTLLGRVYNVVGGNVNDFIEYVMNNAIAWDFPESEIKDEETRNQAMSSWDNYLSTLDTAILGLIGDKDIPESDISAALDEILKLSLWEKTFNRKKEDTKLIVKAGLISRSKKIWSQTTPNQRKGYFLAGVGLKTGQALDKVAAECNKLLVEANGFLIVNNSEEAIKAITKIAEYAFTIKPFIPDKLPSNWREILKVWLTGGSMASFVDNDASELLQFVENGLVYRLPWAMEAMRVRGVANNDLLDDPNLSLDDFELDYALTAMETGTMNRSAALLIQAGFTSRLAAIKVVTNTNASFSTFHELQQWLSTENIQASVKLPAWPTPETSNMWATFVASFIEDDLSVWSSQNFIANVQWANNIQPHFGMPIQLHHLATNAAVLSSDGLLIGTLLHPLNPNHKGLVRAIVSQQASKIEINYLGPNDLWVTNQTLSL